MITSAGTELLRKAPKPLQENFLHRFESLREWEQHQVVFVLKQVSEMMGARHIDAAPLLDTGEVTRGHPTPETQPDSGASRTHLVVNERCFQLALLLKQTARGRDWLI